MKKILLLLLIILIIVPIVFSTTTFSIHSIGSLDVTNRTITFDVVDFDYDSDYDIVFGKGGAIWMARNNGLMGFALPVQISPDNDYTLREVLTGDFDNDGDIDIYFSADEGILGHGIDAYGTTPFTAQQYVYKDTDCVSYAIDYGDIGLDNDIDFATACINDEKIIWIETTGSGTDELFFENHTVQPTDADNHLWRDIDLIDLDEDGDLDIVAGSIGADAEGKVMTWYENEGNGLSWTEHDLRIGVSTLDLAVYDLDGDGDLDIITGNENNITWFKNNGAESFSEYLVISLSPANVQGIDVGDFDNDGDIDIAYVVDSYSAWLENDGSESFTNISLYTGVAGTVNSDIQVIDFDNDGDLDIITSNKDDTIGLRWFENDYIDTTITCTFPTLFCDNFNYIVPMQLKRWLIQLGGGVVNNTFTPVDNQLVLNNTQNILPYHETDVFPTSFTPDSSSAFTKHYLSPVFSSEFDLFFDNLSGVDNTFGYLMSEKQFKPVVWIKAVQVIGNGSGDMDWYYINETQPSVVTELICGNCTFSDRTYRIKINTYFSQRDSFPFNSTVQQDTVKLYADGVLLGTIYDKFIIGSRAEYLSQYEFIKESSSRFKIDNYYVMVGTDRTTSTFEQYYTDFFDNETVEIVSLGSGESGDMATALGSIWADFGLISTASRIMTGLFLMFILAIVMFGIAMSYHTSLSPAVLILVELFFMILLTYIRLLPIWLPFVIVIISAGLGALVMKGASGGM